MEKTSGVSGGEGRSTASDRAFSLLRTFSPPRIRRFGLRSRLLVRGEAIEDAEEVADDEEDEEDEDDDEEDDDEVEGGDRWRSVEDGVGEVDASVGRSRLAGAEGESCAFRGEDEGGGGGGGRTWSA